MSSLKDALRESFGFDEFRPGQEAVIGHLLAGKSAAAVFPTGAGKSLCYQLPALQLPGLTLVVSPLIALMKDQLDQLRRRKIAAARIDSTLDGDEYREVMGALRSGELKILYVAPERFNNERFRETIERARISLFAVDEAHCIWDWGHNFRPDYLKLAETARRINAECVLALTATATPQVLEDVCRGFSIDSECAIRTGFYRPNLTLLMNPTTRDERDAMLLARLRKGPPGAAIVYVTLQKTAVQVAERLRAGGFTAYAYHAGMKTEDRTRVQDAFLASAEAIVVATIAFGMGIDKPNIRYVYHYNLPKSLENLSQEIGRAGRDGKPAICESLICGDDLNVLENFAYGDTPSEQAVAAFVAEVFAADDDQEWSLSELSGRHDVRPLVVRTLFTYLELDGYLEARTPTYSSYRFRPLMSSEEILSSFDGQRREFLRGILRQSKKAKTWFDIDVESAARSLSSTRDRIIRALDYLAEKQMLELQAAGVRNPYHCLRRPENLAELAADLHLRTLEREGREIDRLEQVLALVSHDSCQTAALCSYFGETLPEPCGHCTWCLNDGQPVELPATQPATIDDELWSRAEALRHDEETLAEPRAFARFLNGITSPRLSRRRLTRHDLFGALADVPFSELLARAEVEP
jgi:ATP-dependent DNA helicase RecQ